MDKKIVIEFTPFELETFYRVGNGEMGEFRTFERKAHSRLCNRLRAAHESVTLNASQTFALQVDRQGGAFEWTTMLTAKLLELAEVCPSVKSTDCYRGALELLGYSLDTPADVGGRG